jgi:hypothetical protein
MSAGESERAADVREDIAVTVSEWRRGRRELLICSHAYVVLIVTVTKPSQAESAVIR